MRLATNRPPRRAPPAFALKRGRTSVRPLKSHEDVGDQAPKPASSCPAERTPIPNRAMPSSQSAERRRPHGWRPEHSLGSEPSRPTPDTRTCLTRRPTLQCLDPPPLGQGTRADWSAHRSPAKQCPGWRRDGRRCVGNLRGRRFAQRRGPSCGGGRQAPGRARPPRRGCAIRRTPLEFAALPARKPPATLRGRSRLLQHRFAPECDRWRLAKSSPPAHPTASGAQRGTAELSSPATRRRAVEPQSPGTKADPGR